MLLCRIKVFAAGRFSYIGLYFIIGLFYNNTFADKFSYGVRFFLQESKSLYKRDHDKKFLSGARKTLISFN